MSGYTMFLNGTQMPITPGKLQLKIKGTNKTLTLVNDGEINFLRRPGLTEITVPLLLPMLQSVGQSPDHYLQLFESIMTSLKPARFILSRSSPDGKKLYDTNMSVSLESYSIDEDATNGLDVSVSLTMKLYKEFGTKTVVFTQPVQSNAPPVTTVEKTRETNNAPQAQTYTVVRGDTLWAIARRYYGNGSQYAKIFEANKGKINNPNLIYPGQVLTIP